MVQPATGGGLRAGLTLVELLVVVVIAVIVTGVAFSVYRLNASYYYREDAFIQQYQNLRVAMYTISRDVRMAGNGMSILGSSANLMQIYSPTREILTNASPPTSTSVAPNWFSYPDSSGETGAWGIYGYDGGDNDPDTLTIFRAEVETGNFLGKVESVSGNRLTLVESPPTDAVDPGDIVALANGDNSVLLEIDASFSPGSREIPIKLGGRFTPTSLGFSFPFAGSYFYNFRDVTFVTYYIDQANNQLMADYHDNGRSGFDDPTRESFIVAYNIEDLEVFYFFDTDSVDMDQVVNKSDMKFSILKGDPSNNPKPVKAVAIGLISRAPYGEGPHTRFRPALFNRKADPSPATDDNRPRSVLVQTVFLRNFQK
jgi:type II secretory pathway pseudopilin PulG